MSNEKIIIATSLGNLTLRQISELTGISNEVIRGRYYRGMRGDELLRKKLHPFETIVTFHGSDISLRELSAQFGIKASTLYTRYRRGLRGDELVQPLKYSKPDTHIGEKHGMLTILSVKKGKQGVQAVCRCECGNVCERLLQSVLSGRSHSCGCDRGIPFVTHGKSKTKEHKAWRHIKERCLNKNSAAYPLYGGRGIKMCERWINSFENFYLDMGDAPSPKHSIDRIDTNGNYTPENCRWTTPMQQSRNRRTTIRVKYKENMMPLGELAELLNISYDNLYRAYKRGKLDKYIYEL